MENEIITMNLRDASRLTGLSSTTLRRMCSQNTIRHTRLKNGLSAKTTYLIHRDSLVALLRPYEQPQTSRAVRRVGRPEKVQL
jgi:hypothetical protein